MTICRLQTSIAGCLMKYQRDDKCRPQYHMTRLAPSRTSRQWELYTDVDINLY